MNEDYKNGYAAGLRRAAEIARLAGKGVSKETNIVGQAIAGRIEAEAMKVPTKS